MQGDEYSEGGATQRELSEPRFTDGDRIVELLNLLPDVILSSVRGRVAFVNAAGCASLGARRREKLLGLPLDEVLTLGAGAGSSAATLHRLDGVDVHAELLSTMRDAEDDERLFILQDMSARRSGEQRLRQLQAVALQTADGVAVLEMRNPDSYETHFIFVNDALLEMTGYTREEIIGEPGASLLSAEHLDEEAMRSHKRMLTSGELFQGEYPIRCKDGEILWVDSTVTPLIDESVGLRHVVATWRDVTERRQLESRVLQMERVVAVGSLAAGIGHEVNNPLSYVRANVDYCLETWRELERQVGALTARHPEALDARLREDLEQLSSALEEASEGVERVNAIMSALRKFSNLSVGDFRPVALAPIIASACKLLGNELRHRATVDVRLDALPPVLGNEMRLGQVFLNLLLNAAQALPEGVGFSQQTIRVAGRLEGGEVLVEVHDSGEGIPAEIQPRIFEPFFSTKERSLGTGLGLAITQNIVHAHGGRLEFESEPGVGTTFRIWLQPASLEELSDPHEIVLPAEVPRARVLVIDDEAPLLRVIKRLLSREHDVEGCSSVAQARALMDEASYEVILCDVMMPQTDGISFYKELRAEAPELASRVVFLTGGALNEAQRAFLAREDIDVIYKPFRKRHLLDAISRKLSR